jgi:type II secretory pathway pseudopilin PulG
MNRNPPGIKFPILFKDQSGATLVEELVTIAIIGMGIVILVAMVTTGVLGVRQVDDNITAENLVRSQLELIKDAAYQADPTTSPYPSVSPIAGYSVTVGIEYWDAGNGSFQSSLRNDGLQKITITVTSGGSSLAQTSEYKVDR